MGICPEKGVAVNYTGQLSQQLGERAWVRWLVKRAWAGHQNQFWVTRHKNHSNLRTGSLISTFPEILPRYIFLATHLIGEETKAKTKSKIVLHIQRAAVKMVFKQQPAYCNVQPARWSTQLWQLRRIPSHAQQYRIVLSLCLDHDLALGLCLCLCLGLSLFLSNSPIACWCPQD